MMYWQKVVVLLLGAGAITAIGVAIELARIQWERRNGPDPLWIFGDRD